MSTLSIIIPSLNEATRIEPLLAYLRSYASEAEVILVDGGSHDGTPERAALSTRVVSSPPGRGRQMNVGARLARGEVLWFLHADCRPDPESIPALRQALRDPRVVGGAFELALAAPGTRLRLIEAISNRKNRLAGLLYGDMGIFVRTAVFHEIGGFEDWPLMEDLELCRRLKQAGRILVLTPRMTASAARWREEGVWFNLIRNWALQIAWRLGVSPQALARHYHFPPQRKTRWI